MGLYSSIPYVHCLDICRRDRYCHWMGHHVLWRLAVHHPEGGRCRSCIKWGLQVSILLIYRVYIGMIICFIFLPGMTMATPAVGSPPTCSAPWWTGAARTLVRETQVRPHMSRHSSGLTSEMSSGGPLVTSSGGSGVTPGQNYVQIGNLNVYFLLQKR